MISIEKSLSSGLNPTSFESEWLYHKNASEWWGFTGQATDENHNLYGIQFKLIKTNFLCFKPFILVLAFTNLTTNKQYYYQKRIKNKNKIIINNNYVGIRDMAYIEKFNHGYNLFFKTKNFGAELFLSPNKPPVWHCDKGILKLGETDKTNFFYSFTNLSVHGLLTNQKEMINVNGKGWLDKQGGNFKLTDGKTHWESFALSFEDGEEIKLFSFPQKDVKDGTYIDKLGNYTRLENFVITPTKFKKIEKLKFACEWELSLPKIKEQKYKIKIILEKNSNLPYEKSLAKIINEKEEEVGVCFVELLPGARNKKFKMKLFSKHK